VHGQGFVPRAGQQLGRERDQHDREEPHHVQLPQPGVDPPGVLEDVVMGAPGRGNGLEADQEREVMPGVVLD
jgi:hypothetical protein